LPKAFERSYLVGERFLFSRTTERFVDHIHVPSIFHFAERPDLTQLSCLHEKATPAKLDMLYRKSLYLLALNLAKTQSLDPSGVADIHRQYGDHLHAKGDYDGAMQQFVQTIGHLQPSYVIRKVS
jgi:hypothetical protein